MGSYIYVCLLCAGAYCVVFMLRVCLCGCADVYFKCEYRKFLERERNIDIAGTVYDDILLCITRMNGLLKIYILRSSEVKSQKWIS
jgi:hypothetical protein